jgi:predicted DNA-binding transcriptional regulator AlpA
MSNKSIIQIEFDRKYIKSCEVCQMLEIPRSTIVFWKNNGKLPNPIEVGKMTIWERDPLLPKLRELKGYLSERRKTN